MAQGPHSLMSLDDAWSCLAEALTRRSDGLARQTLATDQALMRVLAEDVVSTVDVPPHDNSAMDGYALRLSDWQQGGGVGASLPQAQRIAAGQVGAELPAGACARIFTGAPIPSGADAVVMQEHTLRSPSTGGGEDVVTFAQPVQAGQNIRRRGEDIACGQVVLEAGRRLGAAALGVAASVGRAELSVFVPPRVGVLTTGDELVMPGRPLPPGGIYNSNRHTLLGLVQACGAEPVDLGTVPDQLDATRAALREAAQSCELVITSGGVSVGEEDHLRQAVAAEGNLDFWALAIKPGKPFVFGHLQRPKSGQALYMGLPGNPVASLVTFLLLARPVIGCLAGEGWRLPRSFLLPAAFQWLKPDKRREFLRARLNDEGMLELHPHQGSGVLSSAAWADGLIDLPAQTLVQPGDRVRWLPWSELLQPAMSQRHA